MWNFVMPRWIVGPKLYLVKLMPKYDTAYFAQWAQRGKSYDYSKFEQMNCAWRRPGY